MNDYNVKLIIALASFPLSPFPSGERGKGGKA